MAAISGVDGIVYVGSTTYLRAKSWRGTFTADKGDITPLGDKDRSYKQTVRDFTGTVEATFDTTDAVQDTVRSMFESTNALATVSLKLRHATGFWYQMTAHVDSVDEGSVVGDPSVTSFAFTADSGVSKTTSDT